MLLAPVAAITPLEYLAWGFLKVVIETLSEDYAMYYCCVSSNEQCCEARQMEATSRVSLLAAMTWMPSFGCLGGGVGVYPSPKVYRSTTR